MAWAVYTAAGEMAAAKPVVETMFVRFSHGKYMSAFVKNRARDRGLEPVGLRHVA